MEPLFQWLGHFWWLIFPVMGMAGGAAKAWERGAKQRHKRRLEVIRAKGELKAAQAAARSVGSNELVTESQQQQLERLFAGHDETTRRWLDYELDVAKLIAFPAMSDGRQPLTAAFLRAKRVADGLRPASAKARLEPSQLTEYRNAVTDYEVAFDVAERDARRLKDSSFTDAERKRLGTAKQLLTVAIDEAATPAERQVAYRRVREELDGLLSLSDEAIDVLEKKVALELTTGPMTTAPADPVRVETPAAPPAEPSTPDVRLDGPPPRGPSTGPWSVPHDGSTTAAGRVIRPKSPS
ncbi:MAG: hypothetical protein ABW204_03075 [Microbacteriaceae bacterium]